MALSTMSRRMRNIKLIIEYDGTNYHGWQTQARSGKATIQETLELALNAITQENTVTYSSGRTDAGVHAWGHVANFKTSSTIPAAAWAPALNHLLPDDIRVLTSEEVAHDFHARYTALGKTYQYRILRRREPTALYRNFAWHVNVPMNISHMKKGLTFLTGRHDFSAFRASGCTAISPIRTIYSANIKRRGDFIELHIEADAFLQYMVRIITGTLVDVGIGRFNPDDVKRILRSCDRKEAGRTAPPHGLYLVSVKYP